MRPGAAILTTLCLCLASGFAQTLPPKRPATAPTEQKVSPTLGFNSRKNVYSVFEPDRYARIMELEMNLPRREDWQVDLGDWSGEKMPVDWSRLKIQLDRALMEGSRRMLMQAFVDAFRDPEECKGITFYTGEGEKPAFTVQLSVTGVLSDNHQQTWGWWLRWPGDPGPANRDGYGFGGTGTQSSARLTARDVCLKIWDDVDPSHFSKSGQPVK